MRVNIDEQLGVIAKLELLLGGNPEVVGQIEFGNSVLSWTHEWPTDDDFKQLGNSNLHEVLRLSEIRYKQSDGATGALSGI